MPKQARVRLWEASALPPDWFKRQPPSDKANERIENDAKAIIAKVVEDGDSAVVELTEKFDKARVDAKNLRVTAAEIEEAYRAVTAEQVSALKFMKTKVAAFEKRVLERAEFATSKDGITIRSVLRPIESVGCYVPGGQAAYPSTLVMTAVPAKAAGVPRVVVCSPPSAKGEVNPLVLVAADICGVDEVYRVGGVQAIAALAYGTETIRPVKKIVGPGSRYVTMAKILVSKDVAIDMPAGPSEVLVLADETANPRLIAFDMISQAEHGVDSVAGLITTSEKLAGEVRSLLAETAASVVRGEIVAKALEKYGFIITCKDMAEAVELANAFAPEHIEIITQNPGKVVEKITSAGLILVGSYSPVALSDYASGTNHVLPTGGFGSAYSGLSALDFTRRVSIVESSKEGLQSVQKRVKVITEAENLPNHYKAVAARFEK
ncbi:histidinol dehydrogenase [Candidatus Bathyarchaeota archaeon A05DMB-2]|jgi:histidinol dehydrogenase|nr:histidinol dehydrogenase [Candidatus Bathyarchaeota archaeon A05DMB-2]